MPTKRNARDMIMAAINEFLAGDLDNYKEQDWFAQVSIGTASPIGDRQIWLTVDSSEEFLVTISKPRIVIQGE